MKKNMQKIGLKTALAMIETIYVNEKLQKFSLVHAYSDKNRRTESATRNLCSRINPTDTQTNFKEIAEKKRKWKIKKDIPCV